MLTFSNTAIGFSVIRSKLFTRENNSVHATFVTRRNAPSDGFLLFWGPTNPDEFDWTLAFRKIGLGNIPASRLSPAEARLIIPSKDGRYHIETIRGRKLEMVETLKILGTALDLQRDRKRKLMTVCPSIIAWSCAAKFALELISRQCFTPMLKSNGHQLYAIWQIALESSIDIGRVRQLASVMPVCAHALYSIPHNHRDRFNRGKYRRPTMMWHPEALLRAFLDASIDAFIRDMVKRPEVAQSIQNTRLQLANMPSQTPSMPLAELLEQQYQTDLYALKLHAEHIVMLMQNSASASDMQNDMDDDSQDDDDISEEDDISVYEDSSGEDETSSFDEDDNNDDESDNSCEEGDEPNHCNDDLESQSVNETESQNNRDNSSNSPEFHLLTDEELDQMRESELRQLMPMKEYVHTVPNELNELPSWESRWFEALINDKAHSIISYHLEDPDLVNSLTNWMAPVHENTDTEQLDAKTGFWLEAPTSDTQNMWFLRYVLVAVEDPSLAIPAGLVFSIGTERLRIAQHSFENPQEQLLTDLGRAAQLFEPLKASLEQSKPEGVFLDVKQAWTFISEVSPMLYSAGFDVRLPEQLTDQGSRRLRARFRICDVQPGDFAHANFGLTDLAGFKWEAALGDEIVSAEEFRQIVALKQPLVQWKGSWVLVDPVQLRDIEALIDRNETSGTLTRFDAMNRALTGVADPNSPNSNIEVVVEGKIADVLEKLTQEDIADVTMKAPDTFVGTLRPYQERGVAWLSYQQRLGLGCCLADDMGLGKTIQLICHVLNQIKKNPTDKKGTLLICPMSVVGNWKREFQRFAPSVNVIIHHGNERTQSIMELEKQLQTPGSVVITTYGLVTKDIDFLVVHHWGMIVLDEAQAIKNASSKRSILVRELKADFRVALTGTPIENRLAELWSILDFLNPGLLGTNARFQRLYGIPIERYNDENVMERLRNLVSPFILRRVKSDPNIIQDLPDKMENKVFCTLTKEQATLYQALVDSTMDKIEHAVGFARHGQVLALLTHLKQIVDHPVLYQKQTDLTCERSGKVQRLVEMLETIIENGEKALIFTQFKEMGDVLVELLQDALNLDSIPFLHGGLNASQRDELVDDFQSEDGPPVFILSLKAGGTGLNLTAATHVFHFDRWWNPAVEDQATDRAYRIGQNQNVQVHKFLTLGSLEEKIDAMLEEKKLLSESIVDATGAWITQFDAEGLRELFSLSSDAMIDEAE